MSFKYQVGDKIRVKSLPCGTEGDVAIGDIATVIEVDVNGYNSHECDIHNHGYYLGAQSQQAKIDGLKKQLTRLGYTDNGAELMKPSLGKTPDFGLVSTQRDKIDELQVRIDEALKILKGWDDQSYRDDMDQLIGEIEDILKGNKDEN